MTEFKNFTGFTVKPCPRCGQTAGPGDALRYAAPGAPEHVGPCPPPRRVPCDDCLSAHALPHDGECLL